MPKLAVSGKLFFPETLWDDRGSQAMIKVSRGTKKNKKYEYNTKGGD